MTVRYQVLNGDCLEILKTLPDCSVDSICTDPPAGIAFMGKEWDTDKGGRDAWIAWLQEVAAECYRVTKPGGHALVWALPRTSHWTGMAWENANWHPRDKIVHIFGSGFPKSLDVSKAIDKAAGAERPVIGQKMHAQKGVAAAEMRGAIGGGAFGEARMGDITAPATDDAKAWEGWGTALKPAVEDWWLFRKPLDGTVAANVLKHGTGAINIDGCRVGNEKRTYDLTMVGGGFETTGGGRNVKSGEKTVIGRFPANLVTDGSPEVVAGFPDNAGACAPASGPTYSGEYKSGSMAGAFAGNGDKPAVFYGQKVNAARFFYCAKASKRDRNEGVGDGGNTHPTVKNVNLMRYLVRLITPPNGVCLDPFMGSGSTGKACAYEGFKFVGIELDPHYVEIAEKRILYALANPPAQDDAEETEEVTKQLVQETPTPPKKKRGRPPKNTPTQTSIFEIEGVE